MIVPLGKPLADQRTRSFEIDQPDIGPAPDDDVTVAAFQRRAGDDPALAIVAPLVDPRRDGGEPGRAVLVIERMSRLHLRDVLRWMQRVAFQKQPAEPSCQDPADRRLARTRHAHDNRDVQGLPVLLQGSLQHP